MPAGSKPGERRGGRQRGAPNQLPDLRAITLKALMRMGGVEYLMRQAETNPMAFMSLLGRVMPREAHVELTGELKVRAEVRHDLIEKLVVLMAAPPPPPNPSERGKTEAITVTPLPAITHDAETMLDAQRVQDRQLMNRKQTHARIEGSNAVAGAVQRAAAMHLERADSSAAALSGAP